MMEKTQNMVWSEMHTIKRFTENTSENKGKEAKKVASIILAAVQLFENYIKGLKKMNAYDAAFTILSDSNWILKNTHETFKDENGKKITIEPGKIYYIDYGNTFYGELSYFHYGLCIGKRENKILVVPITSGNNYISKCYHPVNKPDANKKYRQGLLSEGFAKDCVLKIDDTKFISAGRIEKEETSIDSNILKEIQFQVFQVQFPKLCEEYKNITKKIEKVNKKNEEQKKMIMQLKNEVNHLKQILNNNDLL